MAPNVIGRLSITIAQAKLVRNYGLTRMDPYVRIRIGHFVYETQTDPNGGKNPHWNRVIHSQLPSGVQTIYVEVYDECSFKMDELIAWTEIRIGEAVLRGETHEDWYPLSGKQGDGVEGMLDVVMSFSVSMNGVSFRGCLFLSFFWFGSRRVHIKRTAATVRRSHRLWWCRTCRAGRFP